MNRVSTVNEQQIFSLFFAFVTQFPMLPTAPTMGEISTEQRQ